MKHIRGLKVEPMRALEKIIIIFIVLFPVCLKAQERLSVGVAPFQVNGPTDLGYLGGAVQDAIVGSLIQQGYRAQAYPKEIDPDRLNSVKKGKREPGVLVAGRINVVGQTFRVRLKWVDQYGGQYQDYLQVKNLDELLPQLETFAATRIKPPLALQTAEEIKKETQEKKEAQKQMEGAASPPAPLPPEVKPPKAKIAQPEKVKQPLEPDPQVETEERQKIERTPISSAEEKKRDKKRGMVKTLRGYDFISKRLPYEVRGLAYADVTGDGKKDILLTSRKKLYLYRFQGESLELISEYPGKQLDYFVKVDVLPNPEGSVPFIVLTNLREDRASSKILKFSEDRLSPVVEGIPYQLRVVQRGNAYDLLGAPFTGQTPARHNVFRLKFSGNQVQAAEKLGLPIGINLYNFNWFQPDGSEKLHLVTLSSEGKLRLYRVQGKKFKKLGTSRESYGGSGNYIPVKIKNFFNEVVGDYYGVPPGVQTISQINNSEIVVVKNQSLVKNIVGRVPIISDGRLFRLKFDDLGFVETWASKKVDGSIQDYLVTAAGGESQLMAAVRLRDPGLFGDINRDDSVLLIYNLN